MYQDKAAGRNAARFFDPEMQAVVAARAALESVLRLALQGRQLALHYQPVADETEAVIGAEALARWSHPGCGMVPPGAFISLAEQTGWILPLGQWMIQSACEQLHTWSAETVTEDLGISVDISARQFRQPEFVQQVIDTIRTIRTIGVNPALLTLELTENLLLGDVDDAIAKITRLQAFGVGFSLDDFGTGNSSLAYLKRLPLEQIKIDQSFVRDVSEDPNDAAIARTVIALGHSMGLTVVAEGVETAGQRELLLRDGCRVFQGYLFGRPVPIDQFSPAQVLPVTDPCQFQI